ncbi:MAG: raffinose/stachyose/melibiose transport system permease protein [Chloroflexota bacterium]|jgi:raffinose/stachyose/melibiose transport system permease protein|nr:raffinose/stachyose/melibiose transport system permease protein [Chloroflexota bacterium]
MSDVLAAPRERSDVTRARVLRIPRPRLDLGRALSYLVLIAFSVIYLGPLLMLVNTALKTAPSFAKNPVGIATALNFDNFATAWSKANFPQYLANSVLYAGVATVLFVITGVFVAVPIARRYIKGSNKLFVLFLIALFLPPALVPQFQLMLHLHLYNTQIGYILLFLVNPIGIVILVNYVKSIPRELDEAAALDGCGYFRYVTRIVFPLIKPAIATVMVLHAIGIWNELVLATIYLTNKNFYPITRGLIVFQGVYGNNWPLLAAAVLMMTLPMVFFFLFVQRYIVGGVTAGSLKG